MASAPLNWIAKIGGDVLTTTAQTISAAINELKSAITNLSGADVSYDNTTSQLSATKVQGAIDELKSVISTLDGDDIAYNNTSSGLTATDAQDAIDELDSNIKETAGHWTTPVTAAVGDTSVSISDNKILTTSIIDVYCSNSAGEIVGVPNIAVTTGNAVLSFNPLTYATDFKLHIR